jgi:hypothetical protein
MIAMKAAAGSRVQPKPQVPAMSPRTAVSGRVASPGAKVRPTRKSFHTHRNWKIAMDASAGVTSGRTTLRKICEWLAPSMRAASMTSEGSSRMKLCSRKIASGRPKIECAIQTCTIVLTPSSSHGGMIVMPPMWRPRLNSDSSGMSAIWSGTTWSAKMPMYSRFRPRKSIHERA